MATKKTKLDDFEFDDLNFDDLELGKDGSSDKPRSKLTKISTSFAKGAKETLTSPSTIVALAKVALPPGYNTAINLGEDLKRSGEELYNTAAKELRPALPALRRAAESALPKVKSFVPKRIADVIDNFAKGGNRYRSPSQEEYDSRQITEDLAVIFRTQMEADAQNQYIESTERKISLRVADKQHRGILGRLEAIRHGIDRTVAYQDQITHRYQQKSLELQYRQYFTLRDILKLNVSDSTRNEAYYKALVENTGLSDKQKTERSTKSGFSLKDKLIGGFQQKAAGFTGDFLRKFTDNLKNSVRDFSGGLASAITSGEGLSDGVSTAKEFGGEDALLEMGASQVGSTAADFFGRMVAGKLSKPIGANKGVKKLGNKLSYYLDNLTERVNKFSQSDDLDYSLKGQLLRSIKELIPRQGPDLRVGGAPILTADEVASFDRQTQLSITQIIPGYLSRIHHELAIMRSKDPGTERLTFNMDRGEFTTFGSATEDAKKRLFHPANRGYAQTGLKEFIDHLDKDQELSAETRAALLRQVLMDTAAGQPFNPKRYSDFEESTPELNASAKEELAKLFSKRFNGSDGENNFEALAETSAKFKGLQNKIFDPGAAIKAYDQAGGKELLQALGLLNRKGFGNVINQAKVTDYILDDTDTIYKAPDPKRPTLREAAQSSFDSKVSSIAGSIKDVFVGGRNDPALRASLIQLGEYFDKTTGAVIRKVDDIKGPVVDKLGNVVIAADELKQGLVDRYGNKIKTFFSDRLGVNDSRIGQLRSRASQFTQAVRNAGRVSRNAVLDVYVEGSNSPVLQAIRMQLGEYYDQISGRVIKRLDDIKGPVVDNVGRVILSATDIVKGLRDSSGRPLHDIKTASIERVESLLQQAPDLHSPMAATVTPTADIPYQPRPDPSSTALVDIGNSQLELLRGIYQVLITRNFTEGMSLVEARKSWSRETVDKLLGGVKFGARTIGKVAKTYLGYVKGLFRTSGKIVSGGLGAARSLLSFKGEYLSDVLVTGEKGPALYAKKMRNGDYVDAATGDVIKSIRDIRGPVKDELGNIVLSAEDYAKGIYDTRGRKILRRAFGVIGGVASTVLGTYAAIFKVPFRVAGGIANLINNQMRRINGPRDVYVKGEDRPRLTAILMTAGEYYSRSTRKVIRKPADIDGEVVNRLGDIVLSLEDLRKGIVDVNGRPFGFLRQKIAGLITGAVSGTLSFAGGIAKTYAKVIGGAFGLGGNILSGTMKGIGRFFNPQLFGGLGGGKKQQKTLENIYQLLLERLPKPEYIREGSYQDQIRDKKEKAMNAKGTAAPGDESQAGVLSSFSKWLQSKQDDVGDDGEESDDEGDTYIDASGNERIKGKGPRKGTRLRNAKAGLKKAGRKLGRSKLGRLAGRLGSSKVGQLAGKGLSGLGRAGSGLLRGGGFLARAALLGEVGALAGLGTAATAIGGGLATAAGAVGGGLAAAGGGLAALLTAPVLIGAGALALVGGAAYLGYKYYQNHKDRPFQKLRLTQYGIDPSNGNQVGKVRQLEDILKDHVAYTESGAQLSQRDLPTEKLFNIFGVDGGDDKDKEKQIRFLKWFNGRFKPVFLTHLTALHGIDPKVGLDNLDSALKVEQKEQLLKAVKNHGGDTSLDISPFEDADETIVTGSSQIDAAYAELTDSLKSEKDKDGNKKAVSSTPPPAAAVAAGAAVKAGLNSTDAKVMGNKDTALKNSIDKRTLAIGAGAVSVKTVIQGAPVRSLMGSGSTISPLKAIRMRTYGLVEMDSSMVQALTALETDVVESMSASADGSAKFEGDSAAYFEKYARHFNVAVDDDRARVRWVNWFENRFVPTVASFVAAVRSVNQNADVNKADGILSAEQLVIVANAVIATKRRVFGFNISVWSLVASPWSEAPLNADVKSTFEALKSLKDSIRKKVMSETVVKSVGVASPNAVSPKTSAPAAGGPGSPTTSIFDARIKKIEEEKRQSAIANATLPTATPEDSDVLSKGVPRGSGVVFPLQPLGQVVSHPGNGTGGDINQIPQPKGDGSWEALRDTIVAAASMVGVSPDLMGTMANIESGFRATVKAASSTATGLFQFIKGTWKEMLGKYGKKYGIAPETPPTDPRANALMGAEFLKENSAFLKQKLRRDPTDTELYLAHFMGRGGAGKFLTTDPTLNAVTAFPKEAAANANIFGNRGTPRTVAGVMAELDRRVRSRRVSSSGTIVPIAKAPETGGNTSTTANGAVGGLVPTRAPTTAIEGLPEGRGLADAIAGTESRRPPPMPNIASSSGLQIAQANVSGDSREIQEKELNRTVQSAEVADYRGKAASVATAKQFESALSILGEQLKTQNAMSDKLTEAVVILGSIRDNYPSGTSIKVAEQSSPTVGRRPLEATPSNPPVDLRRKRTA